MVPLSSLRLQIRQPSFGAPIQAGDGIGRADDRPYSYMLFFVVFVFLIVDLCLSFSVFSMSPPCRDVLFNETR